VRRAASAAICGTCAAGLPRVELVIKQKTARALGLTVLSAVLLRAGRVIE
jgi:hypothetical protein